MKSFVIRDIAGLMTGWEFSGYAVDGEDVGTDWGRAIADIERCTRSGYTRMAQYMAEEG